MSEIGGATSSSAVFPSSRLMWLGRALASRTDFGLIVILALPWALLSAGNNWVLDYLMSGAFIDTWLYFGFFLDLPTRLQTFPATYYGSRLSWVLPGHAAYALFPPGIAVYVLHLGFYYAAVISLYLTLKETLSRRTALLSAIFMGCHGYFLWAVGWDYVDGSGLTYFCLTTAALTYAARKQSWIWPVLSGAMYGAMVYSQLFLVVFTPPLIVYSLALNPEWRRQRLVRGFLFSTLGFLGLSGLLAAINYSLIGNFMFYRPSIDFAFELLGSPNPWKQPFDVWRGPATWLVLPALVLLSGIAFLFREWKRRSDQTVRIQILFQVYFLICAFTMLFFELTGSPVLEVTKYASFLVPSMFLALGTQLAPVTDRLSRKKFVFVAAGAVAVFLLAFSVPIGSQLTRWLSAHAPWLLLMLIAAGTMLVWPKGGFARALTLSFWLLAAGLVNVANGHFRTTTPNLSKPGFQAIVQGTEVLRGAESSEELLFWYSGNGRDGKYYRALASTHLWAYRLVNERFPSLEQGADSYQSVGPNTRLVVLSNEEGAFQQADAALRQEGFGAELIEERRIQEGPIGWNMYFIKVHDWPQIESVRLTVNGWPERIALRSESGEQQVVSLLGLEAHPLFRSDMNGSDEWQINRYGDSGGLSIQPDCFASGDNCGVYSYGDPRDHLASPYVKLPAERRVFLATWVKPLTAAANPKIVLQNERYTTVAQTEALSERGDGWMLQGVWLNSPDAQRLRVVVTQPPGTASFLDKLLLIELPAESSTIPALAQ